MLSRAGFGAHGLVVGSHCYTVLGYNATTKMVHLRNPWGYNGLWREWVTNSLGPSHWAMRAALGTPLNDGTDNGAPDFWLPLDEFCDWFRGMTFEYEQ